MPVLYVLVALGALAAYLALRDPMDPTGDEDESAGEEAPPMDPETAGDFGYEFEPSPNKSSRNGRLVTTLVWHYTAGQSGAGAIAWLCNPEARASAHFVIDRDGTITQLVPCGDAAWHCGGSTVPNATSIGVELVNPGYVTRDAEGVWRDTQGREWDAATQGQPVRRALRWPSGLAVEQWWTPYSPEQVAAVRELQARLAKSAWSACLRDQRGHEDIALPEGRKTDPGPLFPWEQLVAFNDRHGRLTKAVV